MQSDFRKLLRVLVALQLLVAAWFALSPDLLPETIKAAERLADTKVYALIDSIIVPLVYLQSALCLALWWPARWSAFGYLLVSLTIAVLGAFSGAAVLSAIDAFLSYLQCLASGAMLGALWIYGYFSLSNAAQGKQRNEIVEP